MKTYKLINNPSRKLWDSLCMRPLLDHQNLKNLCREVFENVSIKKDVALLAYTEKFDQVKLSSIYLDEKELQKNAYQIDEPLKIAINQAYENISQFHIAQIPQAVKLETFPGVFCTQEFRAIEKVGLYIPGGSAPLFSTLLMLAIPAQIVGCKEVVLCTPVNRSGKIDAALCYAAQLCGIKQILKLGGVQAIAALSQGTERTSPVYKIFGPGNQYVVAAKQYAQEQGVAIDLPAGPSEVLVIADDSANPDFIAADLLSQAEHGPDSQVVLLVTNVDILEQVMLKLDEQLESLPRRNIVKLALSQSRFIVFDDLDTCIDFSNVYAPEHLILSIDKADSYLSSIQNAGSVFVGNYSPESAGDYASGTNHTLPTNGYAKSYSGVNIDAFLKKITFQKLTAKGIAKISPIVETMAKAEGLEAHALASRLRREFVENKGE